LVFGAILSLRCVFDDGPSAIGENIYDTISEVKSTISGDARDCVFGEKVQMLSFATSSAKMIFI
jgi:hypothetical protein